MNWYAVTENKEQIIEVFNKVKDYIKDEADVSLILCALQKIGLIKEFNESSTIFNTSDDKNTVSISIEVNWEAIDLFMRKFTAMCNPFMMCDYNAMTNEVRNEIEKHVDKSADIVLPPLDTRGRPDFTIIDKVLEITKKKSKRKVNSCYNYGDIATSIIYDAIENTECLTCFKKLAIIEIDLDYEIKNTKVRRLNDTEFLVSGEIFLYTMAPDLANYIPFNKVNVYYDSPKRKITKIKVDTHRKYIHSGDIVTIGSGRYRFNFE